MAIKSSGSLKFSEIAAEFEDTKPFSMSEFTRGGNKVPEAANNSNIISVAARAARGIGGQMKWSHYYNAVRAIVRTIDTNSEDVDVATLFGSFWTQDIPKILNIDSGITVGATSTSNAALTIPATMSGSLNVNNDGDIQGAGGAGGTAGNSGGAGGTAISTASSVTITNNGNIYAGGGGGGGGGAGGQGANYPYTYAYPYGGVTGHKSSCNVRCYDILRISGVYCAPGYCSGGCSPITGYCSNKCDNCVRDIATTAIGTSDGLGGAGANGRGYNQSIGTAGGGNNATAASNGAGTGGTGGPGGAGGDWGTAGTQGTQGNPGGNNTAGTAGSAGIAGGSAGAAGIYINGNPLVTWDVLGSVAGGTN